MKRSSKPMSPVDNLRATLGRAGIELRLAGRGKTAAAECVLVAENQLHQAKVEAITRAFAIYPTSVLDVARVEYLAICSKIGRTFSLDGEEQGISGLADHDTHGLLVDINHVHDPSVPWYDWIMGDSSAEELVHHELFHLLERANNVPVDDREWDALNVLGFVYHWANHGQDLLPGFLSTYAMTRVSEDKATLYGELLNNPVFVCKEAARDEVLRAKIALLWRRVRVMTGTDSFLPPCIPDPLIPYSK